MRHLSVPLLVAVLLTASCAVGTEDRLAGEPAPESGTERAAPVPPSQGAAETGVYRNLFREWNPALSEADIQQKLDAFWDAMFGTDPDRTVYFPAGSNEHGPMAYIEDIGNDDIRSEGMSYGMMIALQMDRKAEFDALWNWAKTHMQYQDGPRKDYFQWQCQPEGCPGNAVPASDGEEYFATALFFAAHRWGNGTGIYDYEAEANRILNAMLHKEDMNGGVVEGVKNMFNREEKKVVFVAIGDAASFTDPSYHLPAFYELWGRWAEGWNGMRDEDRQFWLDAADTSRVYFLRATHPETGLNPDYATFAGEPVHLDGHGDFRFDAFRTAVNWAVDYAWWAVDPNQIVLTDRLQAFFESEGMDTYVNQYTIDGEPLGDEQSIGLVASNGAASLSASHPRAWKFVEALWELEPPDGQWRYYDGLIAFMAMLHASGQFRIYGR